MKKIISLLFLLSTLFSFAQSYTVLNETAGEIMAFSPIYEDANLYGYVEVRKMNVDEKANVTFKYIVLDKNFNKICTGDMLEKQSPVRAKRNLYDITFSNGYLKFDFSERIWAFGEYVPSRGWGAMDSFFETYQVLDIKNNKIIANGIYNSKIEVFDKKHFSKDDFFYTNYPLEGTGFLVKVDGYHGGNSGNERNTFYATNFKNEKIWEYKSNEILKKNVSLIINVLDYDNQNILLEEFNGYGDKKDIRNFVLLDTKTGKELFKLPIKGTYLLERENVYLKDGKIYEWGRFFEEEKKLLYHQKYLYATYEEYEKKSLGVFQRIIDIKSAQLTKDKYVKYSEFPTLEINENGKVKNDGFLSFQKCTSNPDGTFMILAESYWQKHQYRAYNKLFTFLLDKDFNPIKTTEYEVKRTKGYKYDFSQRLPNKTGRAYFFFDKTDDKDLELNILNYYYKSQKETVQKMPLTNDESSIAIFPAKEGYIGIAEYFKNPEKKGKYMEIRLEKLNYERE